jgi:hypothetical protein
MICDHLRVRISGWQVPPGYLRWAAAGVGLVLLSVAIAAIVNTAGLAGFSGGSDESGTRVAARVSTSSPCNRPNAFEIVTFRYEGENVQARLDGCGHAKGEPVDVTLPPGPFVESMVVQTAGTATADTSRGEGLGLVMLVASGLAGAGYAFLVRRGPRGRALPRALRLAS